MTRDARWLHPGAWWIWALGLAAAASRTTNPLLLLLIIGVAAVVVQARRPEEPWGRSFSFFLKLGIVVIVVRDEGQLLAWVDAAMGVKTPHLWAPFEVGLRCTEPGLLAVKAARFPGQVLDWDRSTLTFPNHAEATRTLVRRAYRAGFEPVRLG